MRRAPVQVRGFTLVEVLAALLFMSIVVPVALHGVSVASRAGILGQRKSAAARVGERVLEELISTGQIVSGAANGTQPDGETNYDWTVETLPWSEDALSVATVKVSFDVQGQTYDVSVSTLYDPAAVTAATTSSLQ